MTPTEACLIAQRAHEGQRYGERPYIDHVQDVVLRLMRDARQSPDALVVAWLHDVVEDTTVTMTELVGTHGLAGPQIKALQAITRREGERYLAYLMRVCADPIARLVKLHDLESNLEHGPPPALEKRYRLALPYVRDAIMGMVWCSSRNCREPIVFLPTKTGKFMPVNRSSLPETFSSEQLYSAALGHESHYATCPDAKRFRKAR